MGFPNTPSNGQTAVVNGITYTYDSTRTAWIRSSTTAFNLYTASNIAPSVPKLGDQWYYIATDVLYEYISDGTSSYWVDVDSLGQVGNISTISDATLQGNVVVGVDTRYSIGASNGYVKNVYANSITANSITVNGNIVPSANVTYNLGSATNRFKDLFLSGTTIDIGGATIKTDSGSGAIALIPQPTVANPNPTGIVVSPGGTISTVSTVAGETSLANIGTSANTASTSGSTSFGNITVNGNIISPSSIGAVVSVTGATTLNSNAFGNIHICTGTTVDYTITLPPVAGNVGKIITFQMSSALTKLVTLDANASETIDGALTRIMWANESAILYCNGTSWNKIGGKTIPMNVQLYKTGGNQSVSNATATKLTLESVGANNSPTAMYDTSLSRVKIVRPGLYQITHAGRITNISTNGNMEAIGYKNGVEYAITSRYMTTGDWGSCQFSMLVSAAINDYFETYVRQYSGVSQNFLSGDYMNSIHVCETSPW